MKKIFSIFAVMLFMASAVSAKTVYCKAPAWWADGAVSGVYAWGDGVPSNAEWPGVRMEAVAGEENMWKFDLDDKYTMLVFTRLNPKDCGAGEEGCNFYWGAKTEDLSIPADKDLYTITNETGTWDPNKVTGEWSKYEASGEPEDAYYLKNGWNGESEWTWKKMTKDGDNYKLENVVFGGEGVNYNSKASDTDSKWVALKDFQGDKIGAFDTVSFVLAPAAGTITATLLGKYVAPADPDYYMKNGWNGGAWEWKKMTKVGDGTHKLENVVFGGEGVNYNKVAADAESEWVAADAFKGEKVEKLDTVTLVLNPAKKEVTATLIGKYVAPEHPYVALIGEMNGWDGGKNPLVAEADGKTASVKVNLELNANNGYGFKILVGSVGLSVHGGENWYSLNRDWTTVKLDWVDENSDPVWLNMDVAGEYTFTWNYADSTITVTFPAKGEDPETKLANGFYLIGKVSGVAPTGDWNYEALKAEHLFAKNAGAGEVEEYTLEVQLVEGDEFQVVRCDNDALGAWYPGGEDTNYKVDAAHAGKQTIYFRPNKDGGEDWWKNCIFVTASATAIDNTAVEAKAVKTVVNGMLVIEKAGVRYNVMGQIVK